MSNLPYIEKRLRRSLMYALNVRDELYCSVLALYICTAHKMLINAFMHVEI